jgi:DNA processing protein
VWALPGRVDHPLSRGAHKLLREGAALIESPEEIAREVLEECTDARVANAQATLRAGAELLTESARSMLRTLEGETCDASEIAARVGGTAPEVLTTLVELELGGWIARGPGGLYRRLV